MGTKAIKGYIKKEESSSEEADDETKTNRKSSFRSRRRKVNKTKEDVSYNIQGSCTSSMEEEVEEDRQRLKQQDHTKLPKWWDKFRSTFRRKKCDDITKNETGRREEEVKERRVSLTEDPSEIYRKIEIDARLTRLEDPAILTTALRHLTRHLHQNGSKIAFPVLEAVDRIHLRSHCLPTDSQQLRELVERVFVRREESLNLSEIYNQFVLAHGRLVFDSSKQWPQCHQILRTP